MSSWQRAEAIAGDASQRRYRRLTGDDGATAVEVIYPPGAPLERDLEVFDWLRRQGVRTPRILDVDRDERRAVLEDFGNRDAVAVLRATDPAERWPLMERLVEPLQRLAEVDADDLPSWNSPLDGDRLRWELTGFELWGVRIVLGRRPTRVLSSFLDELAERVAEHPRRVCHRDYHLNNLFLLPDGEVGVIDCQDVLVGPEAYDVASLLGERALPELARPGDRGRWRRLWAQETEADVGWGDRYTEAAAQRGFKVTATFVRLTVQGRQGYRGWIRGVVGDLRRSCQMLGAAGEVMDLLRSIRDL